MGRKPIEVPVCPECGSDNVLLDAWASFNAKTGEYEIATTFDNGTCEDCGQDGDGEFRHADYRTQGETDD